MRETFSAETPEDHLSLRLKKPKQSAAGIPAALSSMKHGIKKMGFVKTVKTLTMVNQKAGFDCPDVLGRTPITERRSNFAKMERRRSLMRL